MVNHVTDWHAVHGECLLANLIKVAVVSAFEHQNDACQLPMVVGTSANPPTHWSPLCIPISVPLLFFHLALTFCSHFILSSSSISHLTSPHTEISHQLCSHPYLSLTTSPPLLFSTFLSHVPSYAQPLVLCEFALATHPYLPLISSTATHLGFSLYHTLPFQHLAYSYSPPKYSSPLHSGSFFFPFLICSLLLHRFIWLTHSYHWCETIPLIAWH